MFVKSIRKLLSILLLLFLTATLIYEAVADTPTYDEPANMAASYAYVYKNDFRLYPDNPPLVKMLAGIALFPIQHKITFPDQLEIYSNPQKFDLYQFGREFLYKSGNPTREIIFLTRLPNILFTIGAAFLLYQFAKRIYGRNAGLAALFLFSLDPNIRGHGHILAFDIPLAFFMLLILYLTYLFYSQPQRRVFFGFLISICFGLGLLTKFTFVFFAVIYFAGVLLAHVKQKKLLLLSIISASFILLWMFGLMTGYNQKNFDYDKTPLIEEANKSLSNNFSWQSIKKLPVPYYFRSGLMVMYTHNIVSQPAFLLGCVHAKNDWWYYFPFSFLLKTPIPTLIIIFITMITIIKRALWGESILLRNIFPFFFGGAFFFFLILFSHINNVYRYLFPSLVLFILGASQYLSKNLSTARTRWLIIILGCWQIITSLPSFPYDLSYTNEATGIPPQGYKYLSDSEVDWGQDLERLGIWLRKNNLSKETITLSYLGTAEPLFYGIKYKPLQFEDLAKLKGLVAISVGNLTLGDWQITSSSDYQLGFTRAPLDFLRSQKPAAIVGKSIFVYKF